MNTEKLKAMGIDEHTVDTFISDAEFSPREQTILVSALVEMQGVAERDRFVQLAALTNKDDVAFFRQRQAEKAREELAHALEEAEKSGALRPADLALVAAK